ncbi:ABC transporter permease [bacterium]|nr:ABC transporter permease [bacterium]
MIHWLRVAWIEWLRDLRISLRYPMEPLTGMFIMYVLFMAMFLGGKAMAGNLLEAKSLEELVIGFCMWFFALMAMNQMSIDIEQEARAGTLEQVYLCSGNYFAILWIRALTHMSQGAVAVFLFSLVLQFSTGQYLQVPPSAWPALLLIMLLTVAGLCGFGLILGGISLLVKRIGQLSAVIQFALLFPALANLDKLPQPWAGLALHLPLARGALLLKQLLASGTGGGVSAADLLWLAADSAFYVLLGSAVYLGMERIARRGGMLSHY